MPSKCPDLPIGAVQFENRSRYRLYGIVESCFDQDRVLKVTLLERSPERSQLGQNRLTNVWVAQSYCRQSVKGIEDFDRMRRSRRQGLMMM